jgi:hypothetical protein
LFLPLTVTAFSCADSFLPQAVSLMPSSLGTQEIDALLYQTNLDGFVNIHLFNDPKHNKWTNSCSEHERFIFRRLETSSFLILIFLELLII